MCIDPTLTDPLYQLWQLLFIKLYKGISSLPIMMFVLKDSMYSLVKFVCTGI